MWLRLCLLYRESCVAVLRLKVLFHYFINNVVGHFEFQVAVFVTRLPGDSRTRIGFMTFDSTIHFYNLQEGLSQPQMLIVSDIDGKHLPGSLELWTFEWGLL